MLSADTQAPRQRPADPANVLLEPRDTVHVLNIGTGRPIVDGLEAQAAPNAPLPIVRVGGQVQAVGENPLEPGMRVSDLLCAGGGLSETAYATDLTPYDYLP